MPLPNQLFLLFILVPILVESSPQFSSQIQGCSENLLCRRNEYCNRGRCYVDPCLGVICGPNSICQVFGRKALCMRRAGCSVNSPCRTNEYCNQGRCVDNPCSRVRCPTTCQVVQGQAQCDPIPGCSVNSPCRTNEYCNQGRCVDNPCSRVRCPTTCQLVQGQAQCDPIPGCIDNSQCNNNEICDKRRCVVDPCSRGQCPANTRCQVVQGQAQCQPILGCRHNSECSNNEYCDTDRRRCIVNPCLTTQCGTNNKCMVVRGEVQCKPTPESLVFNRNIQGVDVSDDTLGSSQGGSTSGSAQGDNQAGVIQGVNQVGVSDGVNQGSGNQGGIPQEANQIGADQEVNQGDAGQGSNQSSPAQEGNQGDATHGANQSGSAQDGNQEVGSSAVTTGCTDKSQCKDNELCEMEKCVSPCDLIQCGQGAICTLVNGNAQAQCICPAKTSGNPFQQCLPIQEGTGNITNQPSSGSNRTVASVSGCRINSQCGSNKRCQSGSCVDPCDSVKCGLGAICQVSQRQPRCICPAGTEGNPREQCQPISDIQGCATNSQCAENEQCDSGSCVNPCELFDSCGKGAKCQALGRNPQCICPANTQGDPFKQCDPVQASEVAFPGDKTTQIPPINVPGKGTRNPGCLNVPDPGECRGAFKRFYYNEKTDQCDCFLFGGCDVEGVKFTWVTLEECQSICLPGNKDQGPGCKRATLDEVTLFLEEQRRNREQNRS